MSSGRLRSGLGLVLLLIFALSGCVTVRFLERGEHYEQGGQEELALATYKQVLEADPHNERALDGYARVCDRMLERWRQQVQIALERADYARALELAEHARQSLPEHPPAAALARKVRAQVLGLEAQRVEQGDYAGALKIASQIAAFELRDDVQAHARILLLEQRWAASLDVQSLSALSQGHLALAALYALKAESLEASPQRAQRAHQLLEALTARYAARVSIEGAPQLPMPGLIPGLCLQRAHELATLRLSYSLKRSSCQELKPGQRRCELLWTSTLETAERAEQPTILSRTLTIYEPSPQPQPSEAERAALDQEVLAVEDERSRLRRLIDVFRQQFAYGAVLSAQERGAREQYRRALAASGDFLGPMRGRVASSELAQLEAVRQGIPAQEARLEGYYKKMSSIVDERVVELKQQVQNERTLMQGFDQTLGLVVGDTRQVVGQLAYRNFIEKRENFKQIILRADVGKIDVLFQRKEDATQEINGLFQDRTNELKALQESFEDVRD